MHYNQDNQLVVGNANRAVLKDRAFKGRLARAQSEVRQLKAQGYEFVRKADRTYGWQKKGN